MVESCCVTKTVLLMFDAAVIAETDRATSRSCVVLTLFVSVPLSTADTGFVDNAAVAARTVDAVFAANAGGVTTKVTLGVPPFAMLPMLQVSTPVNATNALPPPQAPGCTGNAEPTAKFTV